MNFKSTPFIFLILFCCPVFYFSQTVPNDSIPIRILLQHAVYNDDCARATFYTWTTVEQIEELRTTKKLLSKSKSATKGYSLFDKAINDSIFNGIPTIQLLKQEQFSKKRFAWVNGRATIMGWEGEKYGTQLIKMVVNTDAIIGKLDVNELTDPIHFFNLKGDSLTIKYVMENKNKIAVIYHLNSKQGIRTRPKRKGTYYHYRGKSKEYNGEIPFREFVLVNETMIDTWSYGTEEIKNEIRSEIELLKLLKTQEYVDQKLYDITDFSCTYIHKNAPLQDLEYCFSANKCFDNDYYLFNKKRLQKIIDQLELVLKLQSIPITK
jgi:hypothetical protein